MNRLYFYQKKILNKLILSKHIYVSVEDKTTLQKTKIILTPLEKDNEIPVLGVSLVAPQVPAHISNFDKKKTKLLRQIFLTGRKKKSLLLLQLFVNKIIPFQGEDCLTTYNFSVQNELTLQFPNCNFSNELRYIFMKYPVPQISYNLLIQCQFSDPSGLEVLYLTRLYQLPLVPSFALLSVFYFHYFTMLADEHVI